MRLAYFWSAADYQARRSFPARTIFACANVVPFFSLLCHYFLADLLQTSTCSTKVLHFFFGNAVLSRKARHGLPVVEGATTCQELTTGVSCDCKVSGLISTVLVFLFPPAARCSARRLL